MKNDYIVNNHSTDCAGCSRKLNLHEPICSELSWSQGKLFRTDFHEACWRGLSDHAIGFWKSRILPQRRKKINFNDQYLYEVFRSMADAPEEMTRKYRLIIALLLMYRKKLIFESVEWSENDEYLIFLDIHTKDRYRVLSLPLSQSEVSDLQQRIEQIIA